MYTSLTNQIKTNPYLKKSQGHVTDIFCINRMEASERVLYALGEVNPAVNIHHLVTRQVSLHHLVHMHTYLLPFLDFKYI